MNGYEQMKNSFLAELNRVMPKCLKKMFRPNTRNV